MSGTGRARRFAAGAGALMLAASVVLLAAPGAGAAADREAQGGLTPPAVSVSGPAELTDNTAVFTFTVNTFGECGTAGLTGVDQTTGVSNDFRAGIVAFSAGTTGDQTATLSVGGLTPSSTYALTAFAVVTNCVNASQNVTADGNTVTFTASPGPAPANLVTGPANPVFNTEAEVGGSYVGLGSPVPSFQYGTTTAYGSVAAVNSGYPAASDGSGPIQVQALIFNLNPGTLYHYRLVVNDGHNPAVYGPDETFTTAPTTQVPVGAAGGAVFAGLLALVLAGMMYRARRRKGRAGG